MTNEKEKILLSRIDKNIEIDQATITKNANILNAIIDYYSKLEIGFIENFKDLKSLIDNPDNFCLSTLKGSIPKDLIFGGVKTTERRYLEMITPENLPTFINFVKSQNQKLRFGKQTDLGDNGGPRIDAPFVSTDFYDFENGKITIKENVFQDIKDKYSVYVDSEEKERVYNLVHKTKESLEELNSILRSYEMPILLLDSSRTTVIVTNGKTGEMGIIHQVLSSLINRI